MILDGRNRYAAGKAGGHQFTAEDFKEWIGTVEEAEAWVLETNLHRRHLTAKQKKEMVRARIKKCPGMSNRQIALHKQIEDGGAAAMFYDLRMMDLDGWHPRDIPEALLTNPALQKQQSHTLPPLEQWYVMLLHSGELPGALTKYPHIALTRSLVEDAKAKVPRLRGDLTDNGMRNFLTDEEAIGIDREKMEWREWRLWTPPKSLGLGRSIPVTYPPPSPPSPQSPLSS